MQTIEVKNGKISIMFRTCLISRNPRFYKHTFYVCNTGTNEISFDSPRIAGWRQRGGTSRTSWIPPSWSSKVCAPSFQIECAETSVRGAFVRHRSIPRCSDMTFVLFGCRKASFVETGGTSANRGEKKKAFTGGSKAGKVPVSLLPSRLLLLLFVYNIYFLTFFSTALVQWALWPADHSL